MRLSKTDPTREMMINGSKYMIWVAAWNYRGESELFSAYPHVVQMDCMHGVTSSTDGFNAVGIDGNGHNVQIQCTKAQKLTSRKYDKSTHVSINILIYTHKLFEQMLAPRVVQNCERQVKGWNFNLKSQWIEWNHQSTMKN